MTRVYLSPPDVGAEERRMLLEAFDSNWIAPLGPDVDAFEAELAARVGAGHAVALSSGTAALHLALLLLGVGPGDEVLVPSFTFVATANAVTYLGARPVFVDCRRRHLDHRPGPGGRRAGPAGRAPGDCRPPWSPSTSTASRPTTTGCWRPAAGYGVPLVEDAAEALGATYRGRPAGSFGTPASSPSTGTRSSPPAAAACWSPSRRSWPTGPATWPPRPANRSPTTSTRPSASTTA